MALIHQDMDFLKTPASSLLVAGAASKDKENAMSLASTDRLIAIETAARLLREINEYQARLNDVKLDAKRAYLIKAYKNEIKKRREQLNGMPTLPEPVDSPWA